MSIEGFLAGRQDPGAAAEADGTFAAFAGLREEPEFREIVARMAARKGG